MKIGYGLPLVIFGTAAIAFAQPELAYAGLSYAQVGEIARQVTVQIDGQAPGSGVIIARQGQTYYVLTAEHVVATEDEYEVVTPDGKKYRLDYKNVKKLPGLDLAVLTFTSSQSYRVVEMGDSGTLKESASIFISGFPLLGRDTAQTGYRFTSGNLLAQANRLLAKGYGLAYTNDTFAGMSGGPILNQQGQLIGIHGASKTDTPETQGLDRHGNKKGLNLGIPINSFRRAVPQVLPPLQFPNLPAAALSAQPTAADLLIQSVEQVQAGNRQAALTTISQAIRLQPNYAGAYFARAIFRNDSGDKQGAVEDYNEAIRLNPQFAVAYVNRGRTRFQLDDKQGAIRDYNEAIRLNPQFALAYNNRGAVRADLGDKQGALEDYNEAIRLNPQYAVAYNNRGNTRRELGDRQGAIKDYTEAIRLNLQFALAFYNRGNTRRELGDRQGAIKDYTEAIRLNPQYAPAFYNRGAARADLGDKQGAIGDFQKVAELSRTQGNQQMLETATQILRMLQR
jgi:tetratricopeptide (TPR) repeat protein